jgi:hypothetical protein
VTSDALATHAITAEDLSRIPPAPSEPESSGAAAARAAAESEPGASSAEPGASSSPEALPPDGGAVVQLFEYLMALGVQAAAQRARVPFAQVAHLARLTEDERGLLEVFAPAVAPFLGRAGAASPIVGALGFGVVGVMVLSGRFRDVRAIAPPARPAGSHPSSSARPTPAPSGPRVVDLEHSARWGPLADVVAPGTQVVDSGAFPDQNGRVPDVPAPA